MGDKESGIDGIGGDQSEIDQESGAGSQQTTVDKKPGVFKKVWNWVKGLFE